MSSREQARPFHPASASDYVPLAQLRTLQLERLRGAVLRAWEGDATFRARMAERSLAPDRVRSLEDLARLPSTGPDDPGASLPIGLLASPIHDEVMTRCLAACAIRRGDVVLDARAGGATGAHLGTEALGATVVLAPAGDADSHVELVRDLGVTAICCTPSHFLHLSERARERGAGLGALRVAILGGEPWSEAMRRRMESDTGVKAFDLYGPSEVLGPAMGVECPAQAGLHLLEDHLYPEVVDPRTGEPLPEGAEGELLLTTLSRAARPLVRFRTRDLTAFIPEPCACGRTLRRIRRIQRRFDDLVTVRGVSFHPGQVEAALLAVEGTRPHFQLVLSRARGLDEVEVRVEVTAAAFSDEMRVLASLRAKLEAALAHTLGLPVRVALVAPRTLEGAGGRAHPVVDERPAP